MKFAVAVVMLALAICGSQSSVIPWPYAAHHIPVATSWAHGPVIATHHGAVLAHHGPVLAHGLAHHAVAVHPAGISLAQGPVLGHHGVAVAHHAVAHHAPAVVSVAHHAPAHVAVHAAQAHAVVAAVHHGHEGQYVAKTRGAVHTAPLAGHVASVSSVNVAPAPGTH